jgi:hypothetical protein
MRMYRCSGLLKKHYKLAYTISDSLIISAMKKIT